MKNIFEVRERRSYLFQTFVKFDELNLVDICYVAITFEIFINFNESRRIFVISIRIDNRFRIFCASNVHFEKFL